MTTRQRVSYRLAVTDATAPQFSLHDGAVTTGKPREDKAIAAGRRLGPMKTRG
ncbi:MAG: hypothetical protein ACP5J4_00370 [Anaerolineae bacterium]